MLLRPTQKYKGSISDPEGELKSELNFRNNLFSPSPKLPNRFSNRSWRRGTKRYFLLFPTLRDFYLSFISDYCHKHQETNLSSHRGKLSAEDVGRLFSWGSLLKTGAPGKRLVHRVWIRVGKVLFNCDLREAKEKPPRGQVKKSRDEDSETGYVDFLHPPSIKSGWGKQNSRGFSSVCRSTHYIRTGGGDSES